MVHSNLLYLPSSLSPLYHHMYLPVGAPYAMKVVRSYIAGDIRNKKMYVVLGWKLQNTTSETLFSGGPVN